MIMILIAPYSCNDICIYIDSHVRIYIAIWSYASNIPQNDVGTYAGLYTFQLGSQGLGVLRCRDCRVEVSTWGGPSTSSRPQYHKHGHDFYIFIEIMVNSFHDSGY